jgi:aspartate/glutamate racemase
MKAVQILGGMSWASMAVYVTAAVARGAAALAGGRDHGAG